MIREHRPICAAIALSLYSQKRNVVLALLMLTVFVCIDAGCSRQNRQKTAVRPRTLRDVPAGRLAYQFAPDTETPPIARPADDANALLPAVQNDFTTNRPNDALIRTVSSPDRQRVLVVYATSEDEKNEFRIDLYGAAGDFQRHVTPPGLAVGFAPVAAWSPDGNFMAFVAIKSSAPQPSPSPFDDVIPEASPVVPTMSPSPLSSPVPSVPMFSTEQIYVSSRDGFDLKPLTTRAGLIYFYIAWAPDSHAIASLACKEGEWRDLPLLPAGRPRLVGLDGSERLLDDAVTDVFPAWSPDASKVATAFETELETDVRIYDALTDTPTQATIPLREVLLTSSRIYDDKERAKSKKVDENSADAINPLDVKPISFNPVVTLEWPKPETLYLQTGYVRNFDNGQERTWMRWHLLTLSAQAALLN
jgi:hypothetical protein